MKKYENFCRAYKNLSDGMIHDSTAWLNALSAKNNVAYSYNENIAVGIIKETKEAYLDMFKELRNSVESDWLAD